MTSPTSTNQDAPVEEMDIVDTVAMRLREYGATTAREVADNLTRADLREMGLSGIAIGNIGNDLTRRGMSLKTL